MLRSCRIRHRRLRLGRLVGRSSIRRPLLRPIQTIGQLTHSLRECFTLLRRHLLDLPPNLLDRAARLGKIARRERPAQALGGVGRLARRGFGLARRALSRFAPSRARRGCRVGLACRGHRPTGLRGRWWREPGNRGIGTDGGGKPLAQRSIRFHVPLGFILKPGGGTLDDRRRPCSRLGGARATGGEILLERVQRCQIIIRSNTGGRGLGDLAHGLGRLGHLQARLLSRENLFGGFMRRTAPLSRGQEQSRNYTHAHDGRPEQPRRGPVEPDNRARIDPGRGRLAIGDRQPLESSQRSRQRGAKPERERR